MSTNFSSDSFAFAPAKDRRSPRPRQRRRIGRGLTVAATWALLLAFAMIPAYAHTVIPGPPTTTLNVQPLGVHGNPNCASLLPGDFLFEHKTGTPTNETIPLSFGGLTGSVTVTLQPGSLFDFSFTGDFAAAAVIVKGGPDADFYDYRPDGATADTGLHAPVNPNNNKFYGLSHISFCIVEVRAELEITKTAVDDTITVGEKAAFGITVTNLGPSTAHFVTIDDELPDGVLIWEVVSETTPGSCSITGGTTLHCDVGDLPPNGSFTVVVQTTTTMTSEDCYRTLPNTAVANADNADEVSDSATISVECGAIEVNKFAKVPGSTNTQPVAEAGFTLFDAAGTTAVTGEVVTDVNGGACFDRLALNTDFTLRETTPPDGYGDVDDQIVNSGPANSQCGDGNEVSVDVENQPLTNISIHVGAQNPGATESTIECFVDGTSIGNSGTAADPVDLEVPDLVPGTYRCMIVIDP